MRALKVVASYCPPPPAKVDCRLCAAPFNCLLGPAGRYLAIWVLLNLVGWANMNMSAPMNIAVISVLVARG